MNDFMIRPHVSRQRLVLLLIFFISFSSFAQVVHERWPIKTSYHDLNEKPLKIRLSTFLKLKTPKLKAGEKEKDYDGRLLPGKVGRFHEGDYVETSGWIHYVLHESDDDYHIQVSGSSKSGDNCVIVEVPDPLNATDADLRNHWASARTFIDSLNSGHPAPKGGKTLKPVFVTIRGQLFYDLSHTPNQKRGRGGMSAGTIWEIHPVYTIRKSKYR